jgi:hypothetical protein
MPYYDEEIWRDARFTLAQALDDAASDFVSAFRQHLGLDGTEPPSHLDKDDWLAAKRLAGEAEKAAALASTLITRKGSGRKMQPMMEVMAAEAERHQRDIDAVQRRIEALVPDVNRWKLYVALAPSDVSDPRAAHAIFQTLLQQQALELQPELGALTRRLCALLDYVVRYPNPRAAEYLGRVARCYILDMLPELAVMARASLDVALCEIVPDADVRRYLRMQDRERVGLGARLEYFKGMGLLKEASTSAERIKEAGDAAAHGNPLQCSPDRVLADLAEVLTVLDPLQPGPRPAT